MIGLVCIKQEIEKLLRKSRGTCVCDAWARSLNYCIANMVDKYIKNFYLVFMPLLDFGRKNAAIGMS